MSGVGGALFVPFVFAGAGEQATRHALYFWIGFPLGSAIFSGLCAWPGLRLADRAGLQMPLLRAWEYQERSPRNWGKGACFVSIVTGVFFALFASLISHIIGLPKNPGTLIERLATIPFATVVTETFSHLFLMSVFFFWLKKKWLAILLSSVAFVALFHGQAIQASIELTVFAFLFNFLFATLTGWLYGRYGIESAYLTHAIAHGIVLGIN